MWQFYEDTEIPVLQSPVDIRVFAQDTFELGGGELKVGEGFAVGCTTDWVRLVNTLVNRQLHRLRLGGRRGGRQGLKVPGLGHCVAGF
jgi:hypothetical protein